MPQLANFLPFAPHLASFLGIDPLLPMQYPVAVSAKRDALRHNFFHCLGIRPVSNQGADNELSFADHVMEINRRRVIEPAHKAFLRLFELDPQGAVVFSVFGRTGFVLNLIFLVPTLVCLGILLGANDWIFIWHLVFDSNFLYNGGK
jgi:hypothetical protein